MPSAATAKLEKQASTEAVDPIRQAIIMLEHKIRNLEKRKRKIETYREEQTLGKDLNTDQLNAISKYNEVLQTLDFARDLCKQIHVVASDAAKQQKKQARKEAQEKAQQELAKVKEILIVQEVLQNMGLENIREDFRTGQNGAAQLSDEDLKYLDDLYTEVSPKHGSGQSVSFQAQLQLSAEHLISVVEGKQKEFVGTTYCKLKEIIATIISCGYFDQALEVVEASEESPVAAAEEVPANVEPVGDEISYPPEEQPKAPVIEATPSYVPAPAVSVPAAAQMPPQVPNPAVVPTPVAAVESSYFSTAAPTFVPAQPQAPRPLNEVIGSVSSTFNFLQESELDTPDLSVILTTTPAQHGTPPPAVPVAVAPIQTQTFTNQNFAAVSTAPVQHQVQVVFQASSEISQAHIPGFATGTPNPPPPIPMPPSHQQQQAVQPAVVQQFTAAPPPQTPVVTYASQAQQQIKQEVPPADANEVKTEQNVPVTTMPEAEWTADNSGGGDYASNDNQSAEWSAADNPGDWNQQSEGNQSEEWYSVSQGDNYATQGGARNYGGRGGRGGRGSGGRGSSNGYSGRGRGSGGNYQNGRGGGSGGYGNYRNNEGGNNNFYQNGYQQRDNFNNGNYGGGYKRGGRGGTGAPRGGTGQRGGTGNRGGNNPRGRGGNFMRGGGKQ